MYEAMSWLVCVPLHPQEKENSAHFCLDWQPESSEVGAPRAPRNVPKKQRFKGQLEGLGRGPDSGFEGLTSAFFPSKDEWKASC